MTRHARRCLGCIVAIDARCIGLHSQNQCFVALRREKEPPFFVTEPQPGPHVCWGDYSSRPIVPGEVFPHWMRHRGGLRWTKMLVSLWMEDLTTMPSSTWRCAWELPVDFTSAEPIGSHVRPRLLTLACGPESSSELCLYCSRGRWCAARVFPRGP